MSGFQVIMVFLGIPIALTVLVVLAIAAPSWTRSSRGKVTDEFDSASGSSSIFISSDAAAPNPSILPTEISAQASVLVGGGSRASW
ncbi:MAG: hypothetical protein WBH19_10570 [Candidatus Nanopelagicales bacterium]|nr:hypothetical protein [Actinomycetota bacterium]NCG03437.1 hypothetical protein [Actinomycetales bacterium]MBT5182139.1 hypothetical protein [Actinomycetota bacterium]MBT5500743.1 hypothetical protein [Actinomycetota bacterium]MDA9017152.1 hypothetical protein [Actinomycetota bacterium]